MIKRDYWTTAVAIGIFAAPGCDSANDTIATIQEAVRSAEDLADVQDASFKEVEDSFEDQFMPINPERQTPFEMPTSVTGESPTVAGGASTAAQISVLGFADVGKPRVMLQIGDQTKILGVGDHALNVRIVAIKPPAVTMQMDNLQWTATMFDDRK